jgi:hypothetical protein
MNYRYSREERRAMDNAPELASRLRKGVLRGNRSLLIVLLDVLLIVFMFIIFRVFLYKPQSSAAMNGFEIELSGRVVGESLFAVATIRNEDGEGSAETAYLTFRLGDDEQRLSSRLPAERGGVEEAAVLLPYADPEERIEVTVRIGDLERRLSARPESRKAGKK